MEYDDLDERQAVRAHLSDIRLGKGRRRQLGKPLTRKRSYKEQQRHEDVIGAIVDRVQEAPTAAQRKKTEALLKKSSSLGCLVKNSAAEFWNEVSSSPQRLIYRSLKHKTLDLLAHVLAVYETVIAARDLRAHIELISKGSGVKINPEFDLLKATLMATVDFTLCGPDAASGGPDGGVEMVNRKGNRRARSRYLQSLRWLRSQNVKSYNLKKYQMDNGGGVDTWHRPAVTTVKSAAKEIALEVTSMASDRDYRDLEADYRYYEDIEGDVPLIKKPEVSKWKNMMLRYCVEDLKLAPNEGGMLFVVGDRRTAIGARLIRSVKLGNSYDAHQFGDDVPRIIKLARTLAKTCLTKGIKYDLKKVPRFMRKVSH